MLQKECAVNMSVLLNAAFCEYVSGYQTRPGTPLRWCSAPTFLGLKYTRKLPPWVSSTWPPYLLSNTLNDGKILQAQTLFFMLVICLPVGKGKCNVMSISPSTEKKLGKPASTASALINSHKKSSDLSGISWFGKATTRHFWHVQLNKDLVKILQSLSNIITRRYLPSWQA